MKHFMADPFNAALFLMFLLAALLLARALGVLA